MSDKPDRFERITGVAMLAVIVYFTIANYCNFKQSLGLPTTYCMVKCS